MPQRLKEQLQVKYIDCRNVEHSDGKDRTFVFELCKVLSPYQDSRCEQDKVLGTRFRILGSILESKLANNVNEVNNCSPPRGNGSIYTSSFILPSSYFYCVTML